jgi:two-component system CheB/CheR fusion protein
MPEDASPPDFEELLEYLKQSRGFDFTGYKRASLRRRIDKEMRASGVDAYSDYVEYLEVHPDEFVRLFNAILINVTAFFRDPLAWTYLREELLPAQLESIGPDRPIRVWSAGCASGEEAYSIAMTLADLLGPDEFIKRVKIYGTDVDEEALQIARMASYDDREIAGVPDDYRERYFERIGDRNVFRADLRRSIIFGRLDILRDAPISRLEVLMCRNTLMYFNAETQAQVIARFHFALNDTGVLILGRAETLLSQSALFDPVERKQRIFRKLTNDNGRERAAGDRVAARANPVTTPNGSDMLPAAAFGTLPIAALLFDSSARLVDINEEARELLNMSERDRGVLLQDLDISYRPVDLRTPVIQALSDRRPAAVRGIEWTTSEGVHRNLEVEVLPVRGTVNSSGVALYFHDRTEQRELEERLELSTLELEQAYQEVQSTNEELETTNEELQSTIEELETTNEELQSTNEELETMNEELQSTNDELHTVNEELRIRGDEVDQLNHFLQAILTSFRGGVVVVDGQRKVLVWNAQAAELWGLREDEVTGQDFVAIDIGLPTAQLERALTSAIDGQSQYEEVELDAVTRRGRSVRCKVSITPLLTRGSTQGAILVMELDE